MEQITEREQKLLGYIKVLINAVTMFGIFSDQLIKLFNWKADSSKSIGLSMEFQDEMLKFLENEFQVKYTKLDPVTHEEIKQDEQKNEDN